MKHTLIILLSILLLISCKEETKKIPLPTSIAGLKLEKEKQEKLKDSISKIIITIESKLSELDTLKKLTLVSILEIEPRHYEHFISIQGNTKTDENITIRPQSSGLITGVYVKEGQKVRTGKLLFQLDDAILKNSIFEVQNQLQLAKTTFERQQRLWNQKIGSEMQFLQAKNNKEMLENKIKTLNAQLKNYKVFAPFNGIIDDLIVVKGDLASPQTPLAQIINLYNMYVESDVAENFLKSIKKGNKATLNFTSLNKEITTQIAQVGNSINPDNRTFKVRLNIKNKDGLIKPNLLADIKIQDFDVKNAIVIPSKLVQIDENGNTFVFTITKENEKNIVTKNIVEVKSTYNNYSLIHSGITKKDILINEGSRTVSSKQEIEIYSKKN